MPDIEILSHPLCPHTQRLVIIGLLGGKQPNIDYRLTLVPYASFPQTLPEISPRNREVPVMRIDGVLASDSVDAIAEYMNAVLGLTLLPDDPAERLGVRGAERLVHDGLNQLRSVFTARDRAGLDVALGGFFGALAAIEARLDAADDPAALTHLGHVALAPMGSLVSQYALLRDHPRWAQMPRLRARLRAASLHPVVDRAKCPDYAAEFDNFFRMTGSAFASLAGATA